LREAATGELDEEMLFITRSPLAQRADDAAHED